MNSSFVFATCVYVEVIKGFGLFAMGCKTMKMAEPSTGEAQSSIFRAEDIRVMLNNYYILHYPSR